MNRTLLWIWLPLYALTLAAIVAGLFYARAQAAAVYGTEQAEADWQEWVDEAKRQEQAGPVRRRAPKVSRPPAAILMEEYFVTCLAGALVMGSALFWSFALLAQGAFAAPIPPREDP